MHGVPDYLEIARRGADRSSPAESPEPRPVLEEHSGQGTVTHQDTTGELTKEQRREVERLVREGMARHLAVLEVRGVPLEGIV